MGKGKFNLFRFLPIQLFLLHFRKYQLLLIFWLIIFSTILGHFASLFGAASLFLSPEYLGTTNPFGFSIIGAATGIFIMSWHITTFIVHSKRMPFLGSTRRSFVKYSINNSILPVIYLITYGIVAARYLRFNEDYAWWNIFNLLVAFYLGFVFILMISFLYFFRVNRNILKSALASIGQIANVTNIIPFDSIDEDEDEVIHADYYIDGFFKIKKIERPYQYNLRFLLKVLRRHHRNAVFAIVVAYITLLILGFFMDHSFFRIPAGAGFMLLFSIVLAVVGLFKYLLKSWEILGWLTILLVTSLLTYKGLFDLRSIVYGIKYDTENKPNYDYHTLQQIFNEKTIQQDYLNEIKRLNNWKAKQKEDKPTLIIINVSGGGSRSAYWTFRSLQYADSLSNGQLFKNSIMLTGASGGMIGAAYWHALNIKHSDSSFDIYNNQFQENIGKDLLNPIVFSMATIDFISPFNKINISGKRYGNNRGYAFEKELLENCDNVINKKISDDSIVIQMGKAPLMITNGTIINDGRKLLIAALPISYLTTTQNHPNNKQYSYDAVDFGQFFKNNRPYDIHLSSALRMGATFPVILPVVKLPSVPEMEIMDAGLRDNYGTETAIRYLNLFRGWIVENCGNVVLAQIRDTKSLINEENNKRNPSLDEMIINPIFTIQRKWNNFQTYTQNYLWDEAYSTFPPGFFHKITFEFEPAKKEHSVGLNFHLSAKDKRELFNAIYSSDNQRNFKSLSALLN